MVQADRRSFKNLVPMSQPGQRPQNGLGNLLKTKKVSPTRTPSDIPLSVQQKQNLTGSGDKVLARSSSPSYVSKTLPVKTEVAGIDSKRTMPSSARVLKRGAKSTISITPPRSAQLSPGPPVVPNTGPLRKSTPEVSQKVVTQAMAHSFQPTPLVPTPEVGREVTQAMARSPQPIPLVQNTVLQRKSTPDVSRRVLTQAMAPSQLTPTKSTTQPTTQPTTEPLQPGTQGNQVLMRKSMNVPVFDDSSSSVSVLEKDLVRLKRTSINRTKSATDIQTSSLASMQTKSARKRGSSTGPPENLGSNNADTDPIRHLDLNWRNGNGKRPDDTIFKYFQVIPTPQKV